MQKDRTADRDLVLAPRFVAYEQKKVLYVSFDGESIIRIDPAGYRQATPDDVDWRFDPVPGFEKCRLPAVNGAAPILVMVAPFAARMVLPLPAKPGDANVLLAVYMVAALLRRRLRVRPLLIIAGPPGLGKTTIARAIGAALYGVTFRHSRLPDKVSDFWMTLNRHPYVVLDNVESAPSWFADALASAVTGADNPVRRLYSYDCQIIFRPDVFIAITAMSPAWLRGDLLDRSIVAGVGDMAAGERMSEAELEQHISRNRPALLAATLNVAGATLPLLGKATTGSDDRLVDFAYVGAAIAEAIGGADAREAFDRAFRAARLARFELAELSDPEVAALREAAGDGPFEGTASDFLDLVQRHLGSDVQPDLMARSPKALGSWMRDLKRKTLGLLRWTSAGRRRSSSPRWRVEVIL